MEEKVVRIKRVIKDVISEAQREEKNRQYQLREFSTTLQKVFTNIPPSVFEIVFSKLDKVKLLEDIKNKTKLRDIIKNYHLERYLNLSWSLQLIEFTKNNLTSQLLKESINTQFQSNKKIVYKTLSPFVLFKENGQCYSLLERENELISLLKKNSCIAITAWIGQR